MKASVVVIGKESVWAPQPIVRPKFQMPIQTNQFRQKTHEMEQYGDKNAAIVAQKHRQNEERKRMLEGKLEKLHESPIPMFKHTSQGHDTHDNNKLKQKKFHALATPGVLAPVSRGSGSIREQLKIAPRRNSVMPTLPPSFSLAQDVYKTQHTALPNQEASQAHEFGFRRQATMMPKQKRVYSQEAVEIRKKNYDHEVYQIKKQKHNHKELVNTKLMQIQEDSNFQEAQTQLEEARVVIKHSSSLRNEIHDNAEMIREVMGQDRYDFYGVKRPTHDFWHFKKTIEKTKASSEAKIQQEKAALKNQRNQPYSRSYLKRRLPMKHLSQTTSPYLKRNQIPIAGAIPQKLIKANAYDEFMHHLQYSGQSKIQIALQAKIFKNLNQHAKQDMQNPYATRNSGFAVQGQGLQHSNTKVFQEKPQRKAKQFKAENYEVKISKYFTNQEADEPVDDDYLKQEKNVKLLLEIKQEIVSKEAKIAFEKLQQLLQQPQSSQNGEESAQRLQEALKEVLNYTSKNPNLKSALEVLSQGVQRKKKQILGKPEIRDPYTFKSGAVYKGSWLNGLREGFGEMTCPDGTRYIGMFKNGIACGKGKLINAQGDIFEGNFENGVAVGQGIFQDKDTNMVYEGTWRDGKISKDSTGTESWQDKKGHILSSKVYHDRYTDEVFQNDSFDQYKPGHKKIEFFNYYKIQKFDHAAHHQEFNDYGPYDQNDSVNRLYTSQQNLKPGMRFTVDNTDPDEQNQTPVNKKSSWTTQKEMDESVSRLYGIQSSKPKLPQESFRTVTPKGRKTANKPRRNLSIGEQQSGQASVLRNPVKTTLTKSQSAYSPRFNQTRINQDYNKNVKKSYEYKPIVKLDKQESGMDKQGMGGLRPRALKFSQSVLRNKPSTAQSEYQR